MTKLEDSAPAVSIDTIAHAMMRADWDDNRPLPPDVSIKNYYKMARAAVAAMRDPTEAQYGALSATGKMWRELDSKTVWQTYIDAILEEGQ